MTSRVTLTARECLPRDTDRAILVGRAWVPAEGPSVIGVRGEEVVDLTRWHATVSHLLNAARAVEVRAAIRTAPALGRVADLIANSVEGQRDAAGRLRSQTISESGRRSFVAEVLSVD